METPSFVCAPCNFETTLRANFNRHCNTAKHIKLCECEVFTEIKVVSKQDENSILIKMEELMKKNEILEQSVKQMKSTIDILVGVVNNLASSISGSERSDSVSSETISDIVFECENEIIEPLEIIEPVVVPVIEPVQILKNDTDKPVIRKKNKVALLPEEPKEIKVVENKEEQLRIQRLELELKEMKGKHSEKPEDIIESRRKYMETVPSLQEKRGFLMDKDCIWDIYRNINKSYLKIKTHYDFENPPDYTDEYTSMISHYLKTELMNTEENKRSVVFYKNELYVRKPTVNDDNEPCYKWFLTEVKEFIDEVDLIMRNFNSTLEYSHDTEVAMTYFMNTTIGEKQYKKIMNTIMPYILMK
jgi:uncharacterized protein YoxC